MRSLEENKDGKGEKGFSVSWRSFLRKRGKNTSGHVVVENSQAPGEEVSVAYDSRGRVSQHQINIDTNTGGEYGVNMPTRGNNTIVLTEPDGEKPVAQIVSTGVDIYVFLGNNTAITVR